MITSSANPTIKQIRKLRDRKERQQSGLFYAEGLRIVIEAAHQNAPIQTLVTAPDLLTSEQGIKEIQDLRRRGVEVLEVSESVFKSLALKEDPQGIAAVVAQSWQALEQVHLQEGDLWVALEEVADPGNLGTILRTCDGAGARGVILLDHATDPYDPTAMRASMGAIFTQKLVKTDLDRFSAWVKAGGVPLIGTSGAARLDYHDFPYPQRFVLLMGSERQGLSEKAMGICDQVVSIPMVGHSDSLNLAVATAVVLYEVYNCRRDVRMEGKK
jgi:TrmH family RNA methyltransferase